MSKEKKQLQRYAYATDLIPEEIRGIYVNDFDDLLFLGKTNLNELQAYWRRREHALKRAIQLTESRIDALIGNDPAEIRAISRMYLKSVKTDQKIYDSSIASNITTFNSCSYCRFRDAEDRTFYFPPCALVPEHCRKLTSECAVFDNMPCPFTLDENKGLIELCVSYLRSRQLRQQALKTDADSHARLASKLKQRAEEDKPILPAFSRELALNAEDQQYLNDHPLYRRIWQTCADAYGFQQSPWLAEAIRRCDECNPLP